MDEKLNQNLSNEVADIVKQVKEQFVNKAAVKLEAPDYLVSLSRFNEIDLKNAIGLNTGTRLSHILNFCDLSHPDISVVIDEEMAKRILELVNATRTLSNFPIIQSKMQNLFSAEDSRNLLKNVDNNMLRLFKDNNLRTAFRLKKTQQVVDLESLYKYGENSWKSHANSFSYFIRNNKTCLIEIDKAKNKISKYSKFGLKSISNEVDKSVMDFKISMIDDYFGFHRIKMIKAAAILAKIHGYYALKQRRGFKLIAPNELMAISSSDYCEYNPSVYPLNPSSEIWKITPENIKNIIAFTEELPEAGGKPIFDHFIVLAPFFLSATYSFFDFFSLIKRKIIVPVVLGERNGKCYFITYFSD